MAYDKRRMQDIKYSEKDIFYNQYVNYWVQKNYSAIDQLIESNPTYKYKVFLSYHWNRLQDLTNDGTSWTTGANLPITTNATSDSLAGRFATDFNSIVSKSADYKYVGEWNSSTNYKKNNMVKWHNNRVYYCIQNNSNQVPTNTTYWLPAFVQIAVSTTPPNNLMVGDIYIQEIT